MSKISWQRPELLILLRNHPEETLEQDKCKHPGARGLGNDYNGSCAEAPQPPSGEQKCFNSSAKS